MAIFIERISTFVFGFMVGFIGGWKLTLVVVAVSPLIGLAAGLMAMVGVQVLCKHSDLLLLNKKTYHPLQSLNFLLGVTLILSLVVEGCVQVDGPRAQGLCQSGGSC